MLRYSLHPFITRSASIPSSIRASWMLNGRSSMRSSTAASNLAPISCYRAFRSAIWPRSTSLIVACSARVVLLTRTSSELRRPPEQRSNPLCTTSTRVCWAPAVSSKRCRWAPSDITCSPSARPPRQRRSFYAGAPSSSWRKHTAPFTVFLSEEDDM